MLATDVADYLVARGVPFREAHHVVGALVRAAEARGVTLSALPFDTYRAIHSAFDKDTLDVFDFARSAATRSVTGGTAPAAVRAQIEQARAAVSG